MSERRAQLQRKAAAQRRQLGAHMDAIEARVRPVELGFLKLRTLVHKPVVVAGGTALALFLGPRRALRLVGKTALLVSTARRLLRVVW